MLLEDTQAFVDHLVDEEGFDKGDVARLLDDDCDSAALLLARGHAPQSAQASVCVWVRVRLTVGSKQSDSDSDSDSDSNDSNDANDSYVRVDLGVVLRSRNAAEAARRVVDDTSPQADCVVDNLHRQAARQLVELLLSREGRDKHAARGESPGRTAGDILAAPVAHLLCARLDARAYRLLQACTGRAFCESSTREIQELFVSKARDVQDAGRLAGRAYGLQFRGGRLSSYAVLHHAKLYMELTPEEVAHNERAEREVEQLMQRCGSAQYTYTHSVERRMSSLETAAKRARLCEDDGRETENEGIIMYGEPLVDAAYVSVLHAAPARTGAGSELLRFLEEHEAFRAWFFGQPQRRYVAVCAAPTKGAAAFWSCKHGYSGEVAGSDIAECDVSSCQPSLGRSLWRPASVVAKLVRT